MLTVAFGKSTMSKTSVYELFKGFKDACEDVEDDDRLICPSTSTTERDVQQVKKMVYWYEIEIVPMEAI